jgi:hypothetical protein
MSKYKNRGITKEIIMEKLYFRAAIHRLAENHAVGGWLDE